MVSDFDKTQCNGCRVCADICPVGAISFKTDELTGFDYPTIDGTKCIHCNLCEKKCPSLNTVRINDRIDPEVHAAWSENDEMRLLCTSGGIFYELGKYVIEAKGGAVAACSYADDYRGSYHCVATTLEELLPQCGSKHVQSQTLHIYSKVKELLASRTVLFVGSPCQVAALYRYLGNDPDNLITADFICNSINSPKAQAKYIDYLEERFGSKLVFSRAKDKRYGWNNFGSSAKFADGQEYYAKRSEDARVIGYHHGHLFIRPSCMDCKYKQIPRNADLTLADFWGIEDDPRNPKKEMGTSLVMVNSNKGRQVFDEMHPAISSYPESFKKALAGNPSIFKNATTNGNSEKAFKALDEMRFDKVVEMYKTKEVKRSLLRRCLSKAARIIRGRK